MEEQKKEEGACGSKGGGCGLHCGCCCCKTIKALALVLIGGAIGYAIGHGCFGHRMSMCHVPAAAAVQVEAVPRTTAAPKKAK